ncbi:L-threonylcarbamoyladenylate synthase [Janthinobacterium aquaticum]|uniref:L-threonylcarbamoyladenylate synthase n=1 Tax=Janthinobacterium sp. FT58W TaxID=2654254 RepID=UPI001264521C|nr:L-threonylcarbamoyladenylate synthase [Janthinobacterium sp. FT58W]KAB8043841.1 threonylcarbamoyl-AMP synthase [Janthinobacterium sp. FT58W]
MSVAESLDLPAIARAADALAAGGLVAFPTETVYGLGADAENPAAVARIYEAKGRPSDHPVIVHVAPGADLSHWSDALPPAAQQLVDAFWPGPLTLIVKRAAHIPDAVSGGQDTVGLRCPSHPVAIALLRAFKGGQGGLAAPSANKFGNVSPTTAQHVRDEFEAELASGLLVDVLDGGQSDVGIESTIVDLSRLATHGSVLLRPGHISSEQIAAVIGVLPGLPDAAAPRASGTLESHYAPHTPVAMQHTDQLAQTLELLRKAGHRVALIHYSDLPPASASVRLRAEPEHYAHALYASLRAMDQADAALILVEAPPTTAAWLGVNDRLRRAAFGSAGILQQFLAQ